MREAAALTPAAERSLWGLLAAQRDQVAQVRVDVAADDPIDAALVDPDRAGPGEAGFDPTAHVIGQVVSGPSLRLVDVSRALAARGWREDGRLRVQTDGADRFEIVARAGSATVTHTTAEPDVSAGAAALAAVAFGSVRAGDAARWGWLRARDERTLGLAEALFALPAYLSPDAF